MTTSDIILAVAGLVFLILQFFLHNNYRKITDQFVGMVSDFRSYLDKQNEVIVGKLDAIRDDGTATRASVIALSDFHNRYDADGRPMWFIPQRFLTVMEQTAVHVEQLKVALERQNELIKDLGAKLKALKA